MSHQYVDPANELQRLRFREVSVFSHGVRFTRRGQRELLPPRPSIETPSSDQPLRIAADLHETIPDAMSGFQAINAPVVPQQTSLAALREEDSNSDEDDEWPDPSSFVRPTVEPALQPLPGDNEPSDLCGRKWDVEKIIGDKTVDGKKYFLVVWKDCELYDKDIRRSANGQDCVRCDGKNWTILHDAPAPLSADGKAKRLVSWADTWRWYQDLEQDTPVAIEEYLVSEDERKKLLIDHRNIVRGCADGIDHTEDVKTRIREERRANMGAKQTFLLEATPRRPLTFRDTYVVRTINFGHENKANGALIYLTAVEQSQPCDRCLRGRGPFTKCVVDREMHNGACAGCVFVREGPRCNFSAMYEGEGRRTARVDTTSPEPAPSREASIAATASSIARSPFDSSPAPPDLGSDSTNPTSSVRPRSPLDRVDGDDDMELERLPRFGPLQQDMNEDTLDGSREGSSPMTGRSPLSHLTSSATNSRLSKRSLIFSEDEFEPVHSKKRKQKQESSPPARLPTIRHMAKMPEVEGLVFEHPDCDARAACMDSVAGYELNQSDNGPSSLHNTVYRQGSFAAGEATDAQIRFVISRCKCKYAAYFHAAWVGYCEHRSKRGKKLRYTKESYLSEQFWIEINGVIGEFCADDPQALGSAIDRPIHIDDD